MKDMNASIGTGARQPGKTPAPIPPLAQPNQTREAGAKTPSKTPAKPLAKARKLSPEDAQLGIAEAMQGLEGEAALAASQTPATLPGATPHIEIGQQVRVTSDTSKLGLAALKRTGKCGTITAREPGGQFWDVTFKGRSGGITKFAEDQLEISL